MIDERTLLEKYREPALRFWFEPETSYEMAFGSFEEFHRYLFKDIARCPKGMSREAFIVARCAYIFEYEMAVERVLSGLYSSRHFYARWGCMPYSCDPRDNAENIDRFLCDVYNASTYV